MNDTLNGISSMATRQVLADLCRAWQRSGGLPARFESIGGVDAARRVQAGEAFDLVVLAADAIDELTTSGHLIADSRRPLMESTVAIAVRVDSVRPDVGSEEALRRAVLEADRVGYSTGPSGTALLKLVERWGLVDTLRDRLVQARPGVPVADLLETGAADLGFQQLSELKGRQDIAVLGPMPPGLEVVTTFVGAVGAGSSRISAARAMLDFMRSPATAALKRRHGMAAARLRAGEVAPDRITARELR